MSEPNLDLVPTDDLLEEIFNRFDHACFIGMRVEELGPETTSTSEDGKVTHTLLQDSAKTSAS